MKNIPIRSIQATPTNQSPFDGFKIRNVQEVLGGKDLFQDLHRHDFFFILALQSGSGTHEIDFTSYAITDHTIFFLRPGQVHRLSLKAGSEGYLMEFKRDFYQSLDTDSTEWLRKASTKNLCLLDESGTEKLHTLLSHIWEEYRNRQEGFQQVIQANLGIFLIELVRRRRNRETTGSDANPYAQERLEKFLELLETHITRHKQVAPYADMLHLSPFQLNSITKRLLGKTCAELINDQVILESKRYLLSTSNQVNQIAYHLGYEDISYFIRFFKKHTGHTPEAFRQNFR